MKKIVAGVLLSLTLSQVPVYAIKHESVMDGIKRWQDTSYCKSLWGHSRLGDIWAFVQGC